MSVTVIFKDKEDEIVGQDCDYTEEGENGLELRNKGEAAGSSNQIGYIPYERLLYARPADES